MSTPSNGITPQVIRDSMPPYQLSADLLASTIAALPPPPPDATQAWRHAHLTRLIEEIVARKPADADQARDTAELLIVRELADTFATGAHAPDLTVEQRCRLARTAAELLRSATSLQRTLARNQQQPVPFFGTVMQDEVDLAALDAIWRKNPAQREAPQRKTATPATPARNAAPAARPAPESPKPRPNPPDSAPPDFAPPDAVPNDAAPAHPKAAPPPPADVPTQPQPDPTQAIRPTRPAAPGSDWSITQLDSGPGWSREVLRHRSATPTEAAE